MFPAVAAAVVVGSTIAVTVRYLVIASRVSRTAASAFCSSCSEAFSVSLRTVCDRLST